MLQRRKRQTKTNDNGVTPSEKKGQHSSRTMGNLMKGQHMQRRRSFPQKQFLHRDILDYIVSKYFSYGI